jgi:hypothetical protein
MSTPEPHHPIDPLSQALGRIEGRLDEGEKRQVERFAALDKRIDDLRTTLFWGFGVTWTLIVASDLVARALR